MFNAMTAPIGTVVQGTWQVCDGTNGTPDLRSKGSYSMKVSEPYCAPHAQIPAQPMPPHHATIEAYAGWMDRFDDPEKVPAPHHASVGMYEGWAQYYEAMKAYEHSIEKFQQHARETGKRGEE